MKLHAWLILFFPMCAAFGQAVADPNLAQYGVGKQKGFVQTGATTVAFDKFTFEAFVDLRAGGTLTLATLQGPLLGGTQTLTMHSSGADYEALFSGDPTTAKGNLNGHFNDSTPGNSGTNYKLTMETVPGTSYAVSFSLTGDLYVSDVPTVTITNGVWSGGAFVFDPMQATSISWNFSSFNPATDVVLLSVRSKGTGETVVDQQYQGTNPASLLIAAGTLTPGAEYEGSLTFARLAATDSTTVPGVQGVAFYSLGTSFGFTAVPEPSTYALLALGLGFVGVAFWRRRRSER